MEVLIPSNSENFTTMQNMVDLALGTPELGAVNFSVLHTLLHAMLKKMDIASVKIDNPEQSKSDTKETTTPDSKVDSGVIRVPSTPLHQIQDRLKIIESQISDLNSMPKNNDIVSGFISSKAEDAKRTVSDLWQVLNIRKKVGANEEGLDRLSSLMDTLLSEMRQLKDENQRMKLKLEELSGLSGLGNKVNQLENDLTNLQAELKQLRDKLNEYPNPDSFKNVVTWEGLEQALRGVKDDMDKIKPAEKVFINTATEPMSRPPSSHSGSAGPSEACAEMLERLGHLTDAHDALEKRVEILEKEMPNKADKKDLENMKMPDDLLKSINLMKSQIEQLLNAKNRDKEALAKIRDLLNSLQEKIKGLDKTVDTISEEQNNMTKQIKELFDITADHEQRKADISYVDAQLRQKADKSLVDSKVGMSLFDETTGNLHNLIDDILKKLLSAEEDLRNLLDALAKDLENKVDKDDLNALREWIEKRLRSMAEKLKNMRGLDFTDDEAAGLRKQLLQHFHCISCDRPVDMMNQAANYADRLPDPKGLPPSKSIRPYTTYELDAIRQHAKSYGSEIIDVYQTPRPCGGSHTTTYSHKKMMRMANMNNSYIEDDPNSGIKLSKEELDIQGSDGHIYRGRFHRNHTTMGNYNTGNDANNMTSQDRLPPVAVPHTKSSMNNSERGGFVTRPKSAVKISPQPDGPSGSRPSSARLIPTTSITNNINIEGDSRPTTPVKQEPMKLQATSIVVEESNEFETADLQTNNNHEVEPIVSSTNEMQSAEIHSSNSVIETVEIITTNEIDSDIQPVTVPTDE